MKQNSVFYQIIDEICAEKNIEQKLFSYGWIRELRKNNYSNFIIDNRLNLNNINSFNIAGDKFATYEILKNNNIPFNPKTRSKYYKIKFIEEAEELLKENENKVVIKANNSYKGKDVYFCSNKKEIEEVINKLFENNCDTLSVCPYVEIKYEYRAIYLDGEILYVYKKKKPYIVGDGEKTISKLIEEKFLDEIEIDISRDIDLNSVPKKGEKVTISWKHNLSNGAEPILIDESDEFLNKVKEISIKSAKAININFASVDIAQTEDKKLVVMEINGTVCMNKFAKMIPNGYEIAKKIYTKAIEKLLNDIF